MPDKSEFTSSDSSLSIEERKVELEERRLRAENSFARKWLPTLVTLTIALATAVFGYLQFRDTTIRSDSARIDTRAKDEREWGFKAVELYLTKREAFDLSADPARAQANIVMLAAVAPDAVKGMLSAEVGKLQSPASETSEDQRLESLAAVAAIQNALKAQSRATGANVAQKNSQQYLVYVQYPEGSREAAVRAQASLQKMGFSVPGIEQVRSSPSRLQVRYYRPEQRADASDLAVSLGKALDIPTTADNAIQVISQRQLPAGILEVWLPKI